MVSPGVGASWARSSGSSLSLVKRESSVSPVTPAPPAVKKLLVWRGLNRDSVCSREKIICFSSMSLQGWRRGGAEFSSACRRELNRSRESKRKLPEDVVDAHDALGLRVAAVIDDGSLSFHPDVAAVLSQHAILTAHRLTFGAHWRETGTDESELERLVTNKQTTNNKQINTLSTGYRWVQVGTGSFSSLGLC